MNSRVALITGCGKRDGAGQGIARALAGAGASVVVCDRRPAGVPNRRQELAGDRGEAWGGLDALVAEIESGGGSAASAVGDIGDPDDARAMVDVALQRYDRLDVLVNNAAAPQGLDRADIEKIPLEVFDEVIRVNLRGTYLMCRSAIPVMRRGRWGRIVNISSMAGMVGAPRSAPYSASKAAIIGLTRALAMDVAAWGITVNAVCPGGLATSRAILSEDPHLDVGAELERRARNIPLGRYGMPEDVAAAVMYFAGDGASYVTGQALPLDGGGLSPFPIPRPEEPR